PGHTRPRYHAQPAGGPRGGGRGPQHLGPVVRAVPGRGRRSATTAGRVRPAGRHRVRHQPAGPQQAEARRLHRGQRRHLPVDLGPQQRRRRRAARIPDLGRAHDSAAGQAAPRGRRVPGRDHRRQAPRHHRAPAVRGGQPGVSPDVIVLAPGVGESLQPWAASGPILRALVACLLAGLVSFASPCVIPLVPGYVAYLAGVVGAERPPVTAVAAERQRAAAATMTLEERRSRRSSRLRVVGASLLFVAGFTVVFVLLSAMVLGTVQDLAPQRELLQRLGGAVTIVMGLVFIGLVPALQRDTRMQPKALSTWVGAPLLGAVFALGWTPCLGPTLAAALSVAAGTGVDAARGVLLIVAYCLGLGLPFVLVAFGSTWAMRTVGWLQRNTRRIQVFGGVMLIIVGLLLLSGLWAEFVYWLRD